jgi:SAM-dependent methyltransferase
VTYVFLIILLGLLIAVLIIWRRVSRRRSLPCPAWLSWMVDNPFSMRRTSATLGHLELSPGLSILDAGCGPGRLTIPLARAVGAKGSVVAVDIQPDMLRRARSKATKASIGNVEFLHAALGEGKLPRSRFDRAVLSTVLGEIPDRLAAMREIHAALKPGGILLVNEVMGDPHYQSVEKVETLSREAGFHPGAFYGGRLAFSIKLEKPGNA